VTLRSFEPADLDARLHPFLRRIGIVAHTADYIVITLTLKRCLQRLQAAGIPGLFHEAGREVMAAAAGAVVTEFRPLLAFVGSTGFSVVFPPHVENVGRLYGGRTNPILSGVASVATAALLTEVSASLPDFVKKFPNEALQFNGLATTLPGVELVADWAVREEQLHERQCLITLAAAAGLDTAGTALPKLRAMLDRTDARWQRLSRALRYGTIVKALPSAEGGVWEAVEMPDDFALLRALAEAGQLTAFISQTYGREARQQIHSGFLPPIPTT